MAAEGEGPPPWAELPPHWVSQPTMVPGGLFFLVARLGLRLESSFVGFAGLITC